MNTTAESWLADAAVLDRAVYDAVALSETPQLDRPMRLLSTAANYSRISMGLAAVLAAAGGARGRRAAVSGLASVAATSAFGGLVVKPLVGRRRPTREDTTHRRVVSMPGSRSFPSGHSAAAAAFAFGVGRELPEARLPLQVLAALVGYSRVHTGVHYPGDVLCGGLLGAVIGEVAGRAVITREGDLRLPFIHVSEGSSG